MANHTKNDCDASVGCIIALVIGGIIIYAISQTEIGLNIIGVISLIVFIGLFIAAILKSN